jgi:hypothetical protein
VKPPIRELRPTAALLALLFLAAACSPETGLTKKQACDLAREYVVQPDESGWEHRDFTRYPAAGYRNVEFLECTDFRSKQAEGWAAVHVEARGDEYDLETEEHQGRIIFSAEIELVKEGEAWQVLEKSSF